MTKEDIIRAANMMQLDTVYLLNGTGQGEEEQADE